MSYPCPRCDGEGKLTMFAHIEHGICFKCNGSGKVDKLPTPNILDESCTAIHRLKLMNGKQYYIATFYVWADDGRKYANTGHYDIELIDPSELSDEDIGYCDPVYKHTDICDLYPLHQSIDKIRAKYKALQDLGYKHVDYHPSLYHPEPF